MKKYSLVIVILAFLTACSGPTEATKAPPTAPPPTSTPTKLPPTQAPTVPPTAQPTTPPTAAPPTAAPASLESSRSAEPVIITGVDAPKLIGLESNAVVAFKYVGRWQQVPVQVDERAWKDLNDARPDAGAKTGVMHLFYTDPTTNIGADPNPLFDEDDELVFMSDDAGALAPTDVTAPTGIVGGSGVQIQVRDPLDGSFTAYVYLFQQDGSLDPSAGVSYVNYNFIGIEETVGGGTGNKSTPERSTFKENTTVSTRSYATHFSDEWVSDELKIFAGGANSADILDRHKTRVSINFCGRSEETFSGGANFIANKVGPVRAVRSYIGANSGTYTQRDHFFYRDSQTVSTHLRVHDLDGLMDFYDYSQQAVGMTYFNNLNTQGVTIDGASDTLQEGMLQWELVTGAQGSLVMVFQHETDISDLTNTSIFVDEARPNFDQCTGDNAALGSSGPYVFPLPCTDPDKCPNSTATYTMHRTIHYLAPQTSTSDAQQLDAQTRQPLQTSVQTWEFASIYLPVLDDGYAMNQR